MRKIVTLIAGLVIVAMVLYPPWQQRINSPHGRGSRAYGYHPL